MTCCLDGSIDMTLNERLFSFSKLKTEKNKSVKRKRPKSYIWPCWLTLLWSIVWPIVAHFWPIVVKWHIFGGRHQPSTPATFQSPSSTTTDSSNFSATTVTIMGSGSPPCSDLLPLSSCSKFLFVVHNIIARLSSHHACLLVPTIHDQILLHQRFSI